MRAATVGEPHSESPLGGLTLQTDVARPKKPMSREAARPEFSARAPVKLWKRSKTPAKEAIV